jgi:tetratricopeptide (TPR) repeat protein
MPEQLSLFAEENVTFNTGIQQLLGLDFAGCLETLGRYRKLFPWGWDVSSEVGMATFLHARLADANWVSVDPVEARKRYQVWQEFERAFGYPWKTGSIGEKLQIRFFSRLVDGLCSDSSPEVTRLPDGMPVGLLYVLARRPKEAIRALEASLREKPNDASAYGYLGDAYFLLDDIRQARVCYREAFAMEPMEVDLERLQDVELKGLLHLLGDDEEIGGSPMEWFPVVARLEGLFEPCVLSDLADLGQWITRYQELLENQEKEGSGRLVPKLFYYAMALSDNPNMMKHVNHMDLPAIRRHMKRWHPALFGKYMRQLEGTE